MKDFRFLFAGILFGVVLTCSEVLSWFRIQEMFRFQSFQMYGIIGLAVVTGILSIQIIKKYQLKDVDGTEILIDNQKSPKIIQYLVGGFIFGLGWALPGACPGPAGAYGTSKKGLLYDEPNSQSIRFLHHSGSSARLPA